MFIQPKHASNHHLFCWPVRYLDPYLGHLSTVINTLQGISGHRSVLSFVFKFHNRNDPGFSHYANFPCICHSGLCGGLYVVGFGKQHSFIFIYQTAVLSIQDGETRDERGPAVFLKLFIRYVEFQWENSCLFDPKSLLPNNSDLIYNDDR